MQKSTIVVELVFHLSETFDILDGLLLMVSAVAVAGCLWFNRFGIQSNIWIS